MRRAIEPEDAPLFAKAFMGEAIACACPVNPFGLNERLTLQKGMFVAPGDVGKSFEENVRTLRGYDCEANLVKLVIPFRERRRAIKELYYMNITRATLFPGLDGFAQSLKVYLPTPIAELTP